MHPGAKLVGTRPDAALRARTARTSSPRTAAATTRRSARSTPSATGEVIVIEARGETGSGTLGDILALRAQARGAAGIVTDGGVRDYDAVAAIGIPVFSAGAAPRGARPPARAVGRRRHDRLRRHDRAARRHHRRRRATASSSSRRALAEEVADAALAQEDEDAWIAEQVAAGHPVDGLFPMNAEWRARYDAWQAGERDDRDDAADGRRPQQVAAGLPLDQGAHRATRSFTPGLPARARLDRRRARHERRAGARGDPPARGRGAGDVRAQRRRARVDGRRHRSTCSACRPWASSRAPRPRCRARRLTADDLRARARRSTS